MEKVQEGEKSTAPRLAEEDIVFFRVRLSVEGYPQANLAFNLSFFLLTL